MEKAISLDAKDAQSYALLGVCWDKLGDDQKALINREKAVQLEPNNAEYLISLAASQEIANDTKAARVNLEKALRIEPHYSTALYNLGLLEAEDGNVAKAISLLKQAIEAAPDDKPMVQRAQEKLRQLEQNPGAKP